MCRDDPAVDAASAAALLSTVGWQPQPGQISECVLDASVPGTALTSLLRNGTFGNFTSPESGGDNGDVVDRVYVDDHLASVPDINVTGRGFYTFWYRTEVTLADANWDDCRCGDDAGSQGNSGDSAGDPGGTSSRDSRSSHARLAALWLVLQGANYRVQDVYVNGAPAAAWEDSVTEEKRQPAEEENEGKNRGKEEIEGETEDQPTPGMFLRRRFLVPLPALSLSAGAADKAAELSSVVAMAFRVGPPDHPGFVGLGGQGGDHALAMDGAVMQVCYNLIYNIYI
jgi:hypothetical protein